MDSYLDCLQFSLEIMRGGDCLSVMTGNSIRSISAQGIWDTAEKLSGKDALAAARRLEKMMKNRTTFPEILENISHHTQIEMINAFKQPNWRDYIDDFTIRLEPKKAESHQATGL